MDKRSLGQFFTKDHVWLYDNILKFIEENKKDIVYDPFAWDWDLLKLGIDNLWFKQKKWLDIDKNLKWDYNDSLIQIPKIDNSFIITNPPYLWKSSAKRRWIYNKIEKYFNNNAEADDLYKIWLKKLIETNISWIAIIPETFLNSSFFKLPYIYQNINFITIVEANPFNDTEVPICIVWFNWKNKWKIKIYKNNKFIWNLEELEKLKNIL